MHDAILCVILSMATEKEAKQRRHGTTQPCKRVIEATKLNAETGDPPSQDPRDHKESLKTLQLDFQKMGYTLVFSSLV